VVKRVSARLDFVIDLLFRSDKPLSRLGLMRFSKQSMDLVNAFGVGTKILALRRRKAANPRVAVDSLAQSC
jgi:hypothetical protein